MRRDREGISFHIRVFQGASLWRTSWREVPLWSAGRGLGPVFFCREAVTNGRFTCFVLPLGQVPDGAERNYANYAAVPRPAGRLPRRPLFAVSAQCSYIALGAALAYDLGIEIGKGLCYSQHS